MASNRSAVGDAGIISMIKAVAAAGSAGAKVPKYKNKYFEFENSVLRANSYIINGKRMISLKKVNKELSILEHELIAIINAAPTLLAEYERMKEHVEKYYDDPVISEISSAMSQTIQIPLPDEQTRSDLKRKFLGKKSAVKEDMEDIEEEEEEEEEATTSAVGRKQSRIQE